MRENSSWTCASVVRPAQGGSCAPPLDHEGHVQQPAGLDGFKQIIRRPSGHLSAGHRDTLQLRFADRVALLRRQTLRQLGVPLSKADQAPVHHLYRQVKLTAVLGGGVGIIQRGDFFLRLSDQSQTAHPQQLVIVRRRMGPVVTVFRIAAGGYHDVVQPLILRRYLGLPVLKGSLSSPIGQIFVQDIQFLPAQRLVAVEGTGGQGVQLIQQPLALQLRRNGAAPDLTGKVSHKKLVFVDADGHMLQDVGQGLGPPHPVGLALRLPVGLRHIAQPFHADRRGGDHPVTQLLGPCCQCHGITPW